jgi:RNA polymerase sigma factor (TIGR02999 family)
LSPADLPGSADAEETFTGVYRVLRRLAEGQLRRKGPQTLGPTALVHEAWLRLGPGQREFESRGHFLAVATTAMRQILVDHARRRHAQKRGGPAAILVSGLSKIGSEQDPVDILAVDAALTKLALLGERMARVVEWRFFGGLEEAEIAEALGVDVRTVRRDWQKARAFILGELDP